MDIRVFSPEEFDKIEYAWKKLENGSDMTAFQLYDWYKNINTLYFKEKTKNLIREWIYVLAEENGEPAMIAPIQVLKFGMGYKQLGLPRAFYFIGRQGYTDYLNFIYDEFSADAVKAIFEHLKECYKVNKFILEQLLGKTAFYQYLQENFDCEQYKCICAVLTLPETFEEYKKSLSKSTRQNIRTALNRQKRDGKLLTHEIVYDIDDDIKEILMKIRAERLPQKKKQAYKEASLKGKVYNCFRDVIIKLFNAEQDIIHDNCNPWCFLVKEGDNIAGFYWGITNKERTDYYVILAGVEETYAWYSPSVSHLYAYIEEMYAADNVHIKVLDFTRGGETYKRDLGATEYDAYRVDFEMNS